MRLLIVIRAIICTPFIWLSRVALPHFVRKFYYHVLRKCNTHRKPLRYGTLHYGRFEFPGWLCEECVSSRVMFGQAVDKREKKRTKQQRKARV